MAGPSTAGKRLGRYHLGDPLGGGPCGAVYRAKVYGVAGFERQFAVKRFHQDLVALPVVSTRLSIAARAYGSLEHPRIARLHEYGVAGGEVFTATEMVSGLDVMRLVAMTHQVGNPLPPGAALALATQAARAIGYAHGRGVNHLGICPTNVIVTPDGDVKITDVGIFAQTLTVRPSDDERLTIRIHYMAPEQLVGEPVSAATDVFSLGTLIHELLTGERAFVGVTPLDIEHAILSGHVRDVGMAKPMQRVLARCFARSPFERFPDARALADAIDAALRVAPMVGGRRALAAMVKDTVARIDAMNEGQLSGAMVLAMPMAPAPASAPVAAKRVPMVASPGGAAGAFGGNTTRGPAPAAPIPRRPAPPTRPPPITPPSVVPARTTRVAAAVPPPVPSVPSIPPMVPRVRSNEDSDEHTLNRDPTASPSSRGMSPSPGNLPVPPSRLPNASPLPFQTPPPDLPPLPPGADSFALDEPVEHRAPLRLDSAWPTGEVSAIPDGATPLLDGARPSEPLIEMINDDGSDGVEVAPPARPATFTNGPLAIPTPLPMQPPPPPMTLDTGRQPVMVEPIQTYTPTPPAAPAPRGGLSIVAVALFLVLCAGIGIGGVLAWNKWFRNRDAQAGAAPDDAAATVAVKPTHAPVTPDAGAKPAPDAGGKVAVAAADAGAKVGVAAADAGAKVAVVVPDAAAKVVVAPAAPDAGGTEASDGTIVITSTPSGARVFVDGADEGVTPAKVAAGDKHSIAVVLAGYDLYTADIDGHGNQDAKLVASTPPDGPAGIKVKCKDANRYYVFVDGKPTGELCPTERLGVDVGDHTVEVYDLVSEERRQYPAKVKQTRVSLRVHVD